MTERSTQVLTFKYRLLPSRKQHIALANILEGQRQLYNAALQERIGCYRATGQGRTFYDQCKSLTELRCDPEFSAIPLNIQRWTLKRIDGAFSGFFRRVKTNKGKAGFPRFRGKGRWDSFGFSEFSGITIRGNRLRFISLPGRLRVHLHRPLPEGKILACTFRRDTKGWSVSLQIRATCQNPPATGKRVGLDFGLKELAVLSTGEAIPNPRVAKRSYRELRRRQRALSRCVKGSKRRQKARLSVSRFHAKVSNARSTYLHQVSARLVRENDLIAVENLNVKGLAASMLSQSVNDAAWGKLKQMLTYKAAKAGRELIEVDSRNTSQACSSCGVIVPKLLRERRHSCPHCGLELDRDHNAALNVLHRAVLRPGTVNVTQWSERPARKLAMNESHLRDSTFHLIPKE